MPLAMLQVDLKIVRSAGYLTEVVDGFQVLRTDSAGATFRLYAHMTQRLQARTAHVMLPLQQKRPQALLDCDAALHALPRRQQKTMTFGKTGFRYLVIQAVHSTCPCAL